MELKINIDYEHVLNIVKQLPERDREKLISDIQKKAPTKIENKKINSLQKLLLRAPTWTNQEYNNYLKARKHLNKLSQK